MEKSNWKNWVIAVQSLVIVVLIAGRCEGPEVHTSNILSLQDSIKVHKGKADSLGQEVKKETEPIKALKEKRKAISYKKDFDSTATADTVKKELAKADLVNEICDTIIEKQSHIIDLQTQQINELEKVGQFQEQEKDSLISDKKAMEKEIKRQRRKARFAKIGAVAVVIGGAVAVIVNPVAGAVIISGGVILIGSTF